MASDADHRKNSRFDNIFIRVFTYRTHIVSVSNVE